MRGGVVWLRSRSDSTVQFTVRVTTDARPLTPLTRDEIFTPAFLEFLSTMQPDSAGDTRPRRLEREVRGVELLSSTEKLMAGLPNFATYFGRDMMMSALMMQEIWRPEMSEHVIASVLRKLGPGGDVSHEEALGGQAIRENAAAYNAIMDEYFKSGRASPARADSLLGAAREVLDSLQKVRENYHMIDDEFQLPVLAARYLADSTVPIDRKRGFLLDSTDGGGPRLTRLLREMALVATHDATVRRGAHRHQSRELRQTGLDPLALGELARQRCGLREWPVRDGRKRHLGAESARGHSDDRGTAPEDRPGSPVRGFRCDRIRGQGTRRLSRRSDHPPAGHRDVEGRPPPFRGRVRGRRDPAACRRQAGRAAYLGAAVLGEGHDGRG